MTYNPSDLSVLAYANNFTLWHYSTRDADVTGEGYFDRASDMLRVNDLIIANTGIKDTPSTSFYIVTDNDGVSVTVSAYA